jgi:hypothetical protein
MLPAGPDILTLKLSRRRRQLSANSLYNNDLQNFAVFPVELARFLLLYQCRRGKEQETSRLKGGKGPLGRSFRL